MVVFTGRTAPESCPLINGLLLAPVMRERNNGISFHVALQQFEQESRTVPTKDVADLARTKQNRPGSRYYTYF